MLFTYCIQEELCPYTIPWIEHLPRERLQGTTSTPVVPVFFGRKISNVGGVNHKNKPAQRVPWRFLSLKKYKIVFFGPILLELKRSF